MSLDPEKHPIVCNAVIMDKLRQFFTAEEWGKIICALRNPLQDPTFDMCVLSEDQKTINIGNHFNQ